MTYTRYAVYYVPPEQAAWANFCAAWLGWDMVSGKTLPQPPVPGDLPLPVSQLTQTPRKYGLHATLKPPFRLAPGRTVNELLAATRDLARQLAPARTETLHLARLGRFLALRPTGDESAINEIAAACVDGLDPFRAAPTHGELEKRRQAGLSPEQKANLDRWGYPYVMEDFRFHITLTGRISGHDLDGVQDILHDALAPVLPRPFVVPDIAIAGEDRDGMFHLIERISLSRETRSVN